MRYFVKLIDNEIDYLGMSVDIPKRCTEITKDAYDKYLDITRSIEYKEGYETHLTLYTDFTFTVEYIPLDTE